jgi:hypothetical protein
MTQKRSVDPEIAKVKALLGVAVRRGDSAEEKRLRLELSELNLFAEVKRIHAATKVMSPENRDRIRGIILAALDEPCESCGEDRYVPPSAQCVKPHGHDARFIAASPA